MPKKKIEKEETVYTEAEANEEINTEPVTPPPAEPLKVENNIHADYEDDDDTDPLTLLEKFNRFELGTKTGLVSSFIFLLAVVFRWNWFNSSWWLVLIVAAIGLKSLYTQMTDLKEEKPEEAKIARYSFVTLVVLFVIRDLYITYHFGELLDEVGKLKEFIK
jgi:hypothetical protein